MVLIYVGVYSLVSNSWINGASVTISGPGYSTPYTTQTSWQEGMYYAIFPADSNSTYHLRAEYTGHTTQERDLTTGTTNVRTDFYLTSVGIDIRCESISVNPSNIRQGDLFDVIVSFRNYGTSGTQQKNIYSGTTLIKTDYIDLAAGATTTKTYHLASGACPQLCEGVHTIRCDTRTTTLTIGSMRLNIYIDIQVVENTPGAYPIRGAIVTIDGMSKTTGVDGIAGTWTLETGTNYTFTVTASGYNAYSRSFRYDQPISVTLLAQLTPSAPADPCIGYTCPDICINNNRYSQICQNIGGVATCIQGPLVESNSYYCRSTNYLEFDVSSLPQLIIEYVVADIVHISDTIMAYLPLFDNIQYVGSTFANGKFRMYVNYTPITPILSTNVVSNDPIVILNTHKYLRSEIQSLALISLENFAAFVSGVIIFLICTYAGIRAAKILPIPYIGLITAAIVAGIAFVAIKYVIFDILLASPNQITKTVDPAKQIELIREYSNTYGRPACEQLYPTCVTIPPTCNVEDMKGYNKCIGSWDLAQSAHDDAKSGTYTEENYDALKDKIEDLDNRLTTGQTSPTEAKNEIDDRTKEVNDNSINKQSLTTCPDDQIYDINLKKCVNIEDCSIRNPLTGTCIVTKRAIDIFIVGAGLLIGGYIVYKIVSRRS